MPDGFTVDPDELRTHRTHVDTSLGGFIERRILDSPSLRPRDATTLGRAPAQA